MSRTAPIPPAIVALLLAGPLASPGSGAADSDPGFDQYCIGCHGPDARGIRNSGVDLVASKFVATSSEDALVEFLRAGRLPDDPASLTGRPMPGFSWVADSELKSIAAFLKSRSVPPQ